MTKLLKRVRELPWKTEALKLCNVCKGVLVLKTCRRVGKFYWCCNCEDWRYPEHYKVNLKRKSHLQPEVVKVYTCKMRSKMDTYMEEFEERESQRVKVYNSQEFDQTFLQSLIPK